MNRKGIQDNFIWQLMLPYLYYYAGYFGAGVFLSALFYALGMQELTLTMNTLANMTCMSCGILAILPLVKLERELRKESDGYRQMQEPEMGGKSSLIKTLALAFTVIGIGVLLNGFFWFSGITGSSEEFQQVNASLLSVSLGMGLVRYGLLAPLAEETLFRYIYVHRAKRLFGKWWIAILLSSLLFGIYHMNWVQAAFGTIMGLCLALLYVETGSILACILAHGGLNVISFLCSKVTGFSERIYSPGIMCLIGIYVAGACLVIFFPRKND